MWQHPYRPTPDYLKVVKPNYSWPVIRLVVSLTSDQGHFTFLYRYAKHNREGERKKQTNKHGLESGLSARKGSLWHCAFYELTWACTRSSHKPLTMRTTSRVGWPGLCRLAGLCSRLSDFCSLSCFHLLTASYCRLCHSLDSYLKPTGLFCPALSTTLSIFSRTFLPSSTSGLVGDIVPKPFVWVLRQNRQRDRLRLNFFLSFKSN